MDEVERLDGVAALDDARDVDLVRALADHLDVHVPLRERREHAPCDADHVAHLPADQRQDRHLVVHGHLTTVARARSTISAAIVGKPEGKERDARCRFSPVRVRGAPAACDRARPRSPC